MAVKPIRLLANTRDLIDTLADEGPMRISDLAEAVDLPRPSVYRLVDALTAVGMTRTLDEGRVGLNLRWLHLSDAARDGMSEWRMAGQVLDHLSRSTEQTAFLSVPLDDTALCIDWAQGRGIGVLVLRPGRALPLHAGAAGRIVLSRHADPERYLRPASFDAMTPKTLTTPAALRTDITRTLQQGFVHSDEDVTLGIGAVGVPVIDRDGLFRGALSLGGLAEDITARLDEFVAALQGGAKAILPTGDT